MRFSAVLTTLATVATVASAVLTARNYIITTPIPARDCTTGPIQCCSQVQEAVTASLLLDLLGIVVEDMSVLVGLSCSPLYPDIGAMQCPLTPACCENNTFSPLISIGCIPVDLAYMKQREVLQRAGKLLE